MAPVVAPFSFGCRKVSILISVKDEKQDFYPQVTENLYSNSHFLFLGWLFLFGRTKSDLFGRKENVKYPQAPKQVLQNSNAK